MIYNQRDGQEILMCSLNCLTLYGVSITAFTRTIIKCDNCNTSATPQYHLTMSDTSMRNFCTYQCVMQFQNQFSRTPLTLDNEATQTTSYANKSNNNAPFPTGLPKRIKLRTPQQVGIPYNMKQTGKTYLEKPENQEDKSAIDAYKAKLSKDIAQKKRKPNQRRTPAKKRTPENENICTGDPFSKCIFGRGLAVRECNSSVQFTPSAVSLIEISRSVFELLEKDDVQLNKKITPEYLDYYHTFCLWSRFINIKNKNQETLTQDEKWLLNVIHQREYILLEPISFYLGGFGNIVTETGQHLYPTFPSLPNQIVNGKPAFYGSISLDTHNLYEEIPCLGTLAEAVQYAVSNHQPGPYTSVLSTPQAPVNRNLLGFKSLQSRRAEAKDLAFAHDISPESFYSTRTNTSINIGFINAISDLLANSTTFKRIRTNFTNTAVFGSISQIISTVRTPEDSNDSSDVVAKLFATSLINDSPSSFDAAIFSSYQLRKSLTRSHWLCITPMLPDASPADQAPATDPYLNWDSNRNVRRNLPKQYYEDVFIATSTSQNARHYRDDIIRYFRDSP